MEHSEQQDVVIANCDQHGEFECRRRYIDLIGKWVSTGCPQCSDEAHERDRLAEKKLYDERQQHRLREAGVPLRFQGKTLESYTVEHDKQQIAVAACKRVVDAISSGRPAPNLILIGKPGTGKSHLCCGMISALCHDHKVRRIDLPDLIREIRATWTRDHGKREEAVLDHYGSLELLIIEEIGTGAGSDDERAKIFQVVNRRYEAMLPTVLVSNLDMDSLKKEIGERVIDRMREGSRSLVVFDWQSHRGSV
jgi:DNA replication protein DnaC